MIRHLEETGFSYWFHFRRATKCAGFCFWASLCLCIHAVYPDWTPVTTEWLRAKLDEETGDA